MDFDEYQSRAQETDQRPGDRGEPLVIPVLGLVGEAGTLQSELKKRLRDGEAHTRFAEQVEEELGDLLWYVANIAHKSGLSLNVIAQRNLEKTRNRWLLLCSASARLYDDRFHPTQQLPHRFEYRFAYLEFGGRRKVVMSDPAGRQVGGPLTDNRDWDDGYRFHDVLHLAHAALLGWSPVLRKLLGCKRKADPRIDEVQDGGRAQVLEEAIAASCYEYAERHAFLDGVTRVDWDLLRSIKRLTVGLEVANRTEAEWERVILTGFAVWRRVRMADGGLVRGDLVQRTLEFVGDPAA